MTRPTFEDRLPLSWHPDDTATLTHRELARRHEQNLRLMALLNMLEERPLPPAPGDDGSRDQAVLHAMDLKINMLMELVVEVLAQRGGYPQPRALALDTDHLIWIEPEAMPRRGDAVAVDLYLQPGFPQPLRVNGRVESVDPDHHRVSVHLAELDEDLGEALSRFIFRHHRRQIHEQRRQD